VSAQPNLNHSVLRGGDEVGEWQQAAGIGGFGATASPGLVTWRGMLAVAVRPKRTSARWEVSTSRAGHLGTGGARRSCSRRQRLDRSVHVTPSGPEFLASHGWHPAALAEGRLTEGQQSSSWLGSFAGRGRVVRLCC